MSRLVNLIDLTQELFTYLVQFRERALSAASPRMEEVRSGLEDIFAQMEAKVRRRPSLAAPYQQVRYALAAFTDEVILTSGWDQAASWEAELLEMKFFGTNLAGDRFFEVLAGLGNASRDVLAIYYYCLALGFTGRYHQDDRELLELKADLLAKLQLTPQDYKGRIAPEAYELAGPRLTRLARLMTWKQGLALVLGLAVVLFLADRFVLWPIMTSEVGTAAGQAELRLSQGKQKPGLAAKVKGGKSQPAKENAGDKGAKPAAQEPQAEPRQKEKPSPAAAQTETGSKQAVLKDKKQGFLVQAASYTEYTRANRLSSRLLEMGMPAWVAEKPREQGRSWHVVLVGPYSKFREAQQTRENVERRTGLAPILVDYKDYAGLKESSPPTPATMSAGQKAELERVPAAKADEPARAAARPAPEPKAEPKLNKETAPIPAAGKEKKAKPGWQASVGEEEKDQGRVEAQAWLKGFMVQVGVYAGPRDAGFMASRLRAKGFKALVREKQRGEGRPAWHVVLMGPYMEYKQAKEVLETVARRFGIEPIVVDAKAFDPRQ